MLLSGLVRLSIARFGLFAARVAQVELVIKKHLKHFCKSLLFQRASRLLHLFQFIFDANNFPNDNNLHVLIVPLLWTSVKKVDKIL